MKPLRKILPAVSAALCGACLLLLLLDALQPGWSLFLKDVVKWGLLICCLGVIAGCGALISQERRRLRRRQRRQKTAP